MIGRTQTLHLPSKARLETPLVIPSVSSRGFGWHDLNGAPHSDVSMTLEQVWTHFGESLLVSAYDLHRGVLHQSEELLSGSPTVYDQPRLLIVDSGRYETLARLIEQADGSVAEYNAAWTVEDYEALVHRLPPELDIAIVNFDHHGAFPRQIAAAQQLFARFPERLSVCLLKPEARGGYLSVQQLGPSIPDLRHVTVIGVTEKELGKSLRERICTVALLRRALDDEGLATPIHVFGGLDPVMTPLFYAAGAEIFDGLTWLRYGYFSDLSAYQESVALLRDDLEAPEKVRQRFTELQNLHELRSLKNRLRELHRVGRWAVLGAHAAQLEHAFRTAMTYLEER
jgi:hypothetical protein